jgi:hypothetical protein
MCLRGMSGIVLKAKEFFERVSIQENRRLPDGAHAEESVFDEVAAVQGSLPLRRCPSLPRE